ncbi:glycosyltransferase [candidate division WOR-3 bacterium]|nr:glycosyltransferase [candidate division WOR-3 bacterium]
MNKILVLISDSYGGTERRFSRYFEYARDKKNDITLFINKSLFLKIQKSGLLSATEQIVVFPNIFSAFYNGRWKYKNRFSFLLSKLDVLMASFYLTIYVFVKKPKVIHAVLSGVYAVFLLLILQLFKITITMPSIDLSKLTSEKFGLFFNLLALKLCHRVDVLSPGAVPEIVFKGIKREKIFVSKCSFTDTEKFKPSDKVPKIVFAARLESYHRPMTYLKSVKLAGLKDAQFCIIGKGSQEDELKKIVEEELKGINVRLFFKEDISEELASAIIFVSLKDDNYPSQSLIEAMSCGCSIISSKGGDTELLVKKEFGFIVDIDERIISEKIKELLDNTEKAKEMGNKARLFIKENHTVEKFDCYLRDFWNTG